jgi:hypothetical protein
MTLDYSQDSKIDINALDIEFINLPKIEQLYIKQVAECKKEHIQAIEAQKLAEEEVKKKRSQLILDAHDNTNKIFKKAKVTGPEVEAYYRMHPDYIEVKEAFINASSEVLETEAALQTAVSMKDLIHFTKTKALEQLVALHGQGYFAGPKVPRNINLEMQKKKQEKIERRNLVSKNTARNMRRSKRS